MFIGVDHFVGLFAQVNILEAEAMKVHEGAQYGWANGGLFGVAKGHNFANGGGCIIEKPGEALVERFEPNVVTCGLLPSVKGIGIA